MFPVVDLNGCLLAYLVQVEGANPSIAHGIGCSIVHLLAGNVKLQVLPVYAGIASGSAEVAWRQVERFNDLLKSDSRIRPVDDPAGALRSQGIGVIAAIESATCLCDENEALEVGLTRFDEILAKAGGVLYLTLTRHGESRFGGGSNTDVGLKDDGRAVIDYLAGRGVALDLSHASERLAVEILEYLDDEGLSVPVMASHSNFRAVWDYHANLVDDVAREVISRGGLIGINLIRANLHADDPSALSRHIEHGLALGGEHSLCFGSDFFYWPGHPDVARRPFYFTEHEHAGRFPAILEELEPRIGRPQCERLAHANAVNFIERLWGTGANDRN